MALSIVKLQYLRGLKVMTSVGSLMFASIVSEELGLLGHK
jgi:hypothetical protein